MSISRREVLRISGVAAAALAVAGCNSDTGTAAAEETKAAPAKAVATAGAGSPAPLPAKKGPRVVVVGGGWSGLSVAKYTKKYAPNADVVLVEQRQSFISGPVSNLFLVGEVGLDFITHDYLQAARENKYTYFNASVVGVDKENRVIQTSNGDIDFDYLVLAPGIDYDYSGWTTDPEKEMRLKTEYPAAMIPGSETLTLKSKLENFEGGNFIITVPGGNYRCLPAPYERACMVAAYFKREEIPGKVVVLDENQGITIKAEGFGSAFKELYGDIIEYHPGTKIVDIDLDKKVVTDDFDAEIEFADAAFYPHVRGGKLLEVAGVAKDSAFNKKEADINVFTYEVNGQKNIFCTGDVRPMGFSKSGNTANTEGHYVGKLIAGRINGKETPWESPLTVCYSAVSMSPIHGISINAGYKYDEKAKGFGFTNVGLNEEWRGKIGTNNGKGLFEWAKGMYRDMFA